MSKTQTQEIARREPVEVARLNNSPVEQFGVANIPGVTVGELIQLVIDSEEIPFVVEEDAERAILQRLANAETDEELMGDQKALGWGENMAGVPVWVRGFRILPSTLTDSQGAKCFAVVDALRLDSGDSVILTTSSKGVLVQLLRGLCTGSYPRGVVLEKVGEERKGMNQPLRLVMLDGDRAALAASLADDSNPLDEVA